ncbi:hypothetical protein [Sphingobium sp. Z007]|uniref:hypothetical protein n=1 Tax=Sphingobium sp. Z007 TaxID=627495 RepID=UPI000B49CDB2|nr:hypothetical protein [Sphingobium sp. Z007]
MKTSERRYPTRPAFHAAAPARDALPPIGDNELVQRKATARDGSARLAEKIEALISRTADALTVPSEWADRREDFARAYLGFAVTDAGAHGD